MTREQRAAQAKLAEKETIESGKKDALVESFWDFGSDVMSLFTPAGAQTVSTRAKETGQYASEKASGALDSTLGKLGKALEEPAEAAKRTATAVIVVGVVLGLIWFTPQIRQAGDILASRTG